MVKKSTKLMSGFVWKKRRDMNASCVDSWRAPQNLIILFRQTIHLNGLNDLLFFFFWKTKLFSMNLLACFLRYLILNDSQKLPLVKDLTIGKTAHPLFYFIFILPWKIRQRCLTIKSRSCGICLVSEKVPNFAIYWLDPGKGPQNSRY